MNGWFPSRSVAPRRRLRHWFSPPAPETESSRRPAVTSTATPLEMCVCMWDLARRQNPTQRAHAIVLEFCTPSRSWLVIFTDFRVGQQFNVDVVKRRLADVTDEVRALCRRGAVGHRSPTQTQRFLWPILWLVCNGRVCQPHRNSIVPMNVPERLFAGRQPDLEYPHVPVLQHESMSWLLFDRHRRLRRRRRAAQYKAAQEETFRDSLQHQAFTGDREE